MAAGDTLAVFDALASRQPQTNYATLDARGEHPVLDFDDAVDEATYFAGVLPTAYDGGALDARLTFLASTSTFGDVRWEAAFERQSIGGVDLDTVSFGPTHSVVASADPASGVLNQVAVSLPSSSLSGAVAGEPFRLRLMRRATDASDSMSGDAELLSVELREA